MKRELWEQEQKRRRVVQNYSTIIKQHHKNVSEQGWSSVSQLSDDKLTKEGQGPIAAEDLELYANAMTNVVQWWKQSDRYNDRFMWTLNSVISYYREKKGYSFITKHLRRNYYQKNEASISDAELDELVRKHFPDLDLCQNRPIKLLDVGSCFNPFKGYPETDINNIQVTALDLFPAPNFADEVHKVDWVDISDAKVYFDSYDAVVLSLVLSYLPNAHLRFVAIYHSLRALRKHGLCIIIHNRSQCPRNDNWIPRWETVLRDMGCTRYHTQSLKHIVCMAFVFQDPLALEASMLSDEFVQIQVKKLEISRDKHVLSSAEQPHPSK